MAVSLGRGLVLLSCVFFVQCSGGTAGLASDNAPCRQACEGTCAALSDCAIAADPNCADACTRSLLHADCSNARPADQLTCAELQAAYDCSSYCVAFCTRAPECGTFDAELCLEGCVDQGPPICNSASVPARTCDQLKPEARLYEDAGRALREGGTVVSGGSTGAFGLCRSYLDCQLPLVCNAATNTCGPCSTDADCSNNPLGAPYLCSPEGQCLSVDCVSNTDCILAVCDTAAHVCRQCLADADCTSFYQVCDTGAFECVECLADAHCTGVLPKCNPQEKRCRECLSNADCMDPSLPICSGTGYCGT